MAGEHGIVGDVLGNHRFPQTLCRHEANIAGLGEEVEAEGGFHGGAVDAFRPGPVELGHRGETTDAAGGQAAFETAAVAVLLFGRGEMLEELDGRPPALGGEGHDIVELGSRGAQAEGGELLSQWCRHRAGPPRGAG